MQKFFIVFVLFNLFLSVFYIDTWQNANTTSRSLPIVTYAESGSFRIDKYHELTCDKAFVNNHYYTDKAPLPTYVTLPFFLILKDAGIIKEKDNGSLFGPEVYILGGILIGSIPFVIFIGLLFLQLRKRNSTYNPVLLSMLPLYFSFFFIYAGTFFAHLFSGILLLESYLLLKKEKYLLAGVLSGLAFLSEYNLAVIIFIWGILILIRTKQFKPFLYFSLGILPSLLFIIYYNQLFSSSPFTFLYRHHNFTEISENYGFLWPGISSLWGLSFSFYRGLFWYVPILLFGGIIVLVKIKTMWTRETWKNYLLFPALAYFLFISSYFAWWGGWTYGPRLLFGILFMLTYEAIIYVSKSHVKSIFFWITMGIGALLIFPAKATIVYSAPTGVLNPFLRLIVPAVQKGTFNASNLFSLAFNTQPSNAFYLFLVIFTIGTFILTLWYKKISSR
ncbi:MAG: hypothetical protein K9H49_01510 [Bacteroidales bacterium]|nr:hypothetical protein [Bacteroidales bacterium]MCF8403876.1 hypothetical protein [Bacteroidales bacterium]